jgi:hypothetical protein
MLKSRDVRSNSILTSILLLSCQWICSSATFGDEATSEQQAATGEVLSADDWLAAAEAIALQARSNYDRIRTLQGTCRFTDRMWFETKPPRVDDRGELNGPDRGAIPVEKGEGYWEITTGTASFQFDRGKERYHVFYDPNAPVRTVDCETGEVSRWTSNGDSVHWIVTPDSSVEFDIRHKHGQLPGFAKVASVDYANGGRIAYQRDADALTRLTRFLDVRDFFASGGSKSWECCEHASRRLKGEDGAESRERLLATGQMRRRGAPALEYTLMLQYENDIQSETVFDGASGFNAVSYVQRDKGQPLEERSISFREFSGIFIPVKFELKMYQASAGKTALIGHRSCSIDNARVNEDVDDANFGIEQFKFAYGERLFDERKNALLVYDRNGEFTPADEFQFDPRLMAAKRPGTADISAATGATGATGEDARRVRGSRWFLIANGAVIAALAAYVLVRMRAARRK